MNFEENYIRSHVQAFSGPDCHPVSPSVHLTIPNNPLGAGHVGLFAPISILESEFNAPPFVTLSLSDARLRMIDRESPVVKP